MPILPEKTGEISKMPKYFNFVSKQILNKDHAMYACKKLSKTLTFFNRTEYHRTKGGTLRVGQKQKEVH